MTSEVSNFSTFQLAISDGTAINKAALAKVRDFLPTLDQQTRAFDRNNSQTTLSLMTLTMLNGQSPMRMLRQVLAEVEQRKLALSESQLSHAKLVQEIAALEGSIDPVQQAEYRVKCVSLATLESKINGSVKDIATLIDAYHNLQTRYGIEKWDEADYERAEKKHHVRRAFELMYRNLLMAGRAQTSTIEYLQQYGVHPQVALAEVATYMQKFNENLAKGVAPDSSDLEDFLDAMAEKYLKCADSVSQRMFGVTDFVNTDYMLRLEDQNDL